MALSNLAKALSQKVKPKQPEPQPQPEPDPFQQFFSDPLLSRCLSIDVQRFCTAWLTSDYQA